MIPQTTHKGNRVFGDKDTLKSMLKLRRQGFTYHSLGFIFGVDHSSIYHHCKNIVPLKRIAFELPSVISTFLVDTRDIISLIEIRPKRDKTYSEYLKEEHDRNNHFNFLT